MGPVVLTVHDVASYLNVDEKTIYRLAQRAELPGFKVAGTWRFRQLDIEAWIDQRKEQVSIRRATGADGRGGKRRGRSSSGKPLA